MNALTSNPTPAQAAAAIIAAFNMKTEKSKAIGAQNRHVLADKSAIGVPFSLMAKEALYPIVVNRAEGTVLHDIDGNRYIDVLMGMGINLFGHNPPFIRDAIEAQLAKGFALGPQSDLAGETAALFCTLTGKERVTFTNTGTEAVMTALRLARAATGRRKIAMFIGSYHGHSDQVLNRIAAPMMSAPFPPFPAFRLRRRRMSCCSPITTRVHWTSWSGMAKPLPPCWLSRCKAAISTSSPAPFCTRCAM